MASVSLRNIRKKFGPVTVLEKIDLEIEDGDRPEFLMDATQ